MSQGGVCKKSGLAFSLVVLCASWAWGQATTSLRGLVTDQSGGAVPGAQVKLTNPATGLERTARSGGDGVYEFLQVQPGAYRLSITAEGFRHYERTDVELLVK